MHVKMFSLVAMKVPDAMSGLKKKMQPMESLLVAITNKALIVL